MLLASLLLSRSLSLSLSLSLLTALTLLPLQCRQYRDMIASHNTWGAIAVTGIFPSDPVGVCPGWLPWCFPVLLHDSDVVWTRQVASPSSGLSVERERVLY